MTSENWQKVKEIFHHALELSEGERGKYIKKSCGADGNLLKEIETLFEAHEEAEKFIELPALAPIGELIEETKDFSREGQIIGSYKIENEIGKGGMGAVYLASRADKEFEKKVAVKLIKRGYDTEEIIKRFRHERQILATLEHPFITRLIDGGATDDGLPFLVMDYVEGLPLNQYADENELSINERLRLFLQICAAVQYAHRNLIIHRDLKPSNILITKDGTPRLLDFGIAKLTASSAEQTIERTLTQFQAMTPEYASPEQVNGEIVTTASDIYSLGVVLYELLTGHRPFSFKTKKADEISRIISDAIPTKPSSVCRNQGLNVLIRNPQTAIRNLKGDLDNIILMAVRKEPERRYSSVEQFADDIQKYLNGLPVIAQEDTFSYRAEKFVKRNKGSVAAGIGIALSLIGGLAATTRQARIARKQRDRALAEAEKAEKINQFLQKMLASADPREQGKDFKVIEVLSEAERKIETDFANQPEISADLHTTIGQTYLGLGLIKSAEKHLKNALRLRLEIFPRKSPHVAVSLNNYGKILQTKGELNEAEPLYRESLDILRKRGKRAEVANVLDNLGYLLALKGRNREAIFCHAEELEIRRTLFGENHPSVAAALKSLAGVFAIIGDYQKAEPLHRKALAIYRKYYPESHPDVLQAMLGVAKTSIKYDKAEAEKLFKKILELRRQTLGENHPDVVWSLYDLAFLNAEKEDYELSEKYAREALKQRGIGLTDENPVVGSALLILGRSLLGQNNAEAAKKALEECLELRRRTLGENHWLLATANSFYGECLALLGEHEKGKKLLIEGYETLKEKFGETHDQTRAAFERLQKIGARASQPAVRSSLRSNGRTPR